MGQDFNIKVTVRNARLLRAIRDQFGTSAELARVAGINQAQVASLVTMKARPFLQNGELSSGAEAIVSALGVPADDLWPEHIRRLKAKNATVEIEMDADTFAEIAADDPEQQTVYKLALQKWSGVLSDRERDIVARRSEGEIYEDCGRAHNISKDRARQIEYKAMLKIRGAARRDGVRGFQDLH